MLKDITLGQFFPGDSVLHRLDPRLKLVVCIAYIAALFMAKSFVSYGILLAFLLACVLLSRIKLSIILRGLRPLLFILVFTALLNLFYTQGDHVLFEWGFIHITSEGVVVSVFMVLRILMLITGTLVMLTYTTSPIALTDALEALMKPLNVIRVPVHELAMMMTIALRFIPTLIEETDKIMSAQKARGADFESGNIFRRAKAMIPLLIPLFISAIRRAEELAEAMECRCYHGGEGRTRLKTLHLTRLDFAAMPVTLVIFMSAAALGVYGL